MNKIVPILLIVVLAAILPSIDSECCKAVKASRNPNDPRSFCADGTVSTPCCGYKKCNIFCCACKTPGCRKKNRRRRSLGQDEIYQSGAEFFFSGNQTFPFGMDSDQDGRVSLLEVQEFWGVGPGSRTKRPTPYGKTATHCEIEFKQVDTNSDGHVDASELSEHF